MVEQVGLDLELADRHRNTDDDHQALGNAPKACGILKADTFGSATHQAVGHLRQQHANQQHQGRTKYLWQVEGKHVEGCGDPLEA
ncbi:hypothetical protein D3C78_1385740 [compost metagenome]